MIEAKADPKGLVNGRIKIDFNPNVYSHLLHLNSDPRRRATAGRNINDGVRDFISIIQRLADNDLKPDRPAYRRRTKGPRYRDSFVPLPNRQDGIDKLSGGFQSTHHFARGLEHGSPEHEIVAVNKPMLVFPFKPNSTRSVKGGPPGDWPVTFRRGNRTKAPRVMHPGSPAFEFIKRARVEYRRKATNKARGTTRLSSRISSVK